MTQQTLDFSNIGVNRSPEGRLSLVSTHSNPESWPQGKRRQDFNPGIRSEFKMESPRYRGQQKHGLHHGKRGANALARTAAEGKVCKARKIIAVGGLALPSFGLESFGIRKKPLVPLGYPLHQEAIGSSGQTVAADLKFRPGSAPYAPGRRIKAHGFLDDAFCITQSRNIGHGRLTVAENIRQFSQKLRLRLLVQCQQVPCP